MTETAGMTMKRLREAKNISQAAMANDLDISQSALSSYENGTRIPRDCLKVRISEYLGRSVQYIFFR